MEEQDRQLILGIAHKQKELNDKLNEHIAFDLEHFNRLERKIVFPQKEEKPIIKEEWFYQGIISGNMQELANELRQFMIKYKVKNLVIQHSLNGISF